MLVAPSIVIAISQTRWLHKRKNNGGVLKSMLTLNEAIIDVKEG